MNALLIRIAAVATIAIALLGGAAIAQPPPMAVVSPDVHPDRTVTFRIPAPNAKQVTVSGEFDRQSPPMTKDDAGVWPVTVGPLKPNVYGYGFAVDGFNTPDPSNTFVRVGSLAYQSQVEVTGEEEAYQAIRNVPQRGACWSIHRLVTRAELSRNIPFYTCSTEWATTKGSGHP